MDISYPAWHVDRQKSPFIAYITPCACMSDLYIYIKSYFFRLAALTTTTTFLPSVFTEAILKNEPLKTIK